MTAIVRTIFDRYDDFIASGDTRVTSWMLMGGPAPTIILLTMYVLFVKLIGPAWMRKREPFELRYTMLLYNITSVIVNLYFVVECLKILLNGNQESICSEHKPNDPDAQKLYELGWWFLLSKFLEFADTVFFVLRKKYSNISTLHFVHHTSVPVVIWTGLRMSAGTYNYFFPLINGMVHVLMYTYYSLAALGPAVQKYLWWKKYITVIQMIQFMMVFLYYTLLITLGCKISTFSIITNLFMAGLFLVLFADYFQKTYGKKNLQETNNDTVINKNRNCAPNMVKSNIQLNNLRQNLMEKKTG